MRFLKSFGIIIVVWLTSYHKAAFVMSQGLWWVIGVMTR